MIGSRLSRATVTVDLNAVANNVAVLRERAAPAELWAVVKADGYGHGAAVVGRAALEAGATRLCAATWEEARGLREELPGAPLLVMGPLAPGEEDEVRDVEVALSSVAAYTRLRAAGRQALGVHVKVDTGMGRWGMDAGDALRIGERLAEGGRLHLAGLMSHLASADADHEFTALQLDAFASLAQRFPPCPRHVANSAAALGEPAARWDAVRCGVAVYGLSPFMDDPAHHGLRPAMRFESYVADVKRLAPGQSTGYGRRFVAREPIWIGLAPVGYADGVPRLLSGRMDVLVRGRRRRVAATISMDQLTFVIGSECDVEPGDAVILIGREGGEEVRSEEWAQLTDTINYEIVTDIAPRRRRVEHVVLEP